ncbi:MAG: hypothetical protein OEW40_04320 [Cyclobacteriaceae bacterium]|jgi:hypothetical protein|nr:hypothetical protein [Cyclobacteriaceae bacterium]
MRVIESLAQGANHINPVREIFQDIEPIQAWQLLVTEENEVDPQGFKPRTF